MSEAPPTYNVQPSEPQPILDMLRPSTKRFISNSSEARGMLLRGMVTLSACCDILGFGSSCTHFGSLLRSSGVRTESVGETSKGKCSRYYDASDVTRLSAILGGKPEGRKNPGASAVREAGKRLADERAAGTSPSEGRIRTTKRPVSRAELAAKERLLLEEKARRHADRIEAIRRAADEKTHRASPPPEQPFTPTATATVQGTDGKRARAKYEQFPELVAQGYGNIDRILAEVPGAPSAPTAQKLLERMEVRCRVIGPSGTSGKVFRLWHVATAAEVLKAAVASGAGRGKRGELAAGAPSVEDRLAFVEGRQMEHTVSLSDLADSVCSLQSLVESLRDVLDDYLERY